MKTQRLAPPVLLTRIAFVLAAGLLTATPAIADQRPCKTVAAKHLETLGIDSEDVTDIAMIRILNNPEFGTIRELQAWATLLSCPGNVVINLTPRCRVKDAYTRGGCRVENIAHF